MCSVRMLNSIKNGTRNRHKDEAVNVKFRFGGLVLAGYEAMGQRQVVPQWQATDLSWSHLVIKSFTNHSTCLQ
jgi:hypothetical protein